MFFGRMYNLILVVFLLAFSSFLNAGTYKHVRLAEKLRAKKLKQATQKVQTEENKKETKFLEKIDLKDLEKQICTDKNTKSYDYGDSFEILKGISVSVDPREKELLQSLEKCGLVMMKYNRILEDLEKTLKVSKEKVPEKVKNLMKDNETAFNLIVDLANFAQSNEGDKKTV